MIDNLPHSNDFLSKVNKAQPNKMIKEGTTLPNWKRSWTNITNSEGCNSSDIVDIQLAHVDSIHGFVNYGDYAPEVKTVANQGALFMIPGLTLRWKQIIRYVLSHNV